MIVTNHKLLDYLTHYFSFPKSFFESLQAPPTLKDLEYEVSAWFVMLQADTNQLDFLNYYTHQIYEEMP